MPSEARTKAEAIVIDSAVIDNRLLISTNEWLRAKIADATWQLKKGLKLPKGHPLRDMHFELALKALGNLGGE